MLAFHDLAYVTNGHERQKLDLYLPDEGKNLPLVIWVHGGAFRMGSKEGSEHDPVPVQYVEQGYAVASLNYRLSQHSIFPAQIEDCKAAVRWLRAHAAQFRLDPNRFGAWGPSAGGHLVTMLGMAGHVTEFEVGEHLDVSSRVQCVVDYFGPTDFLQMDTQRLPTGQTLEDTAILGKEMALLQLGGCLSGLVAVDQGLEGIQCRLRLGCRGRGGECDQGGTKEKTADQIRPYIQQRLHSMGDDAPQAFGIGSTHGAGGPPAFNIAGQQF